MRTSAPGRSRRHGWKLFGGALQLAANGMLWAGVACSAFGQVSDRTPTPSNPAAHAFPALGMLAERKVDVAWDRYYDHAGLASILEKIHRAFPDLTKLYSVGKSVEGRDLW